MERLIQWVYGCGFVYPNRPTGMFSSIVTPLVSPADLLATSCAQPLRAQVQPPLSSSAFPSTWMVVGPGMLPLSAMSSVFSEFRTAQ